MPIFDLLNGSKKFKVSSASLFSFALSKCSKSKAELTFPESITSNWEIAEAQSGTTYTLVFRYKPEGGYALGSFLETEMFSFEEFGTLTEVSWTNVLTDLGDPALNPVYENPFTLQLNSKHS